MSSGTGVSYDTESCLERFVIVGDPYLVGGCVIEAIFEDDVDGLRFIKCVLRYAD